MIDREVKVEYSKDSVEVAIKQMQELKTGNDAKNVLIIGSAFAVSCADYSMQETQMSKYKMDKAVETVAALMAGYDLTSDQRKDMEEYIGTEVTADLFLHFFDPEKYPLRGWIK